MMPSVKRVTSIAPTSAAMSVQNETSGSATASASTRGSTRRVVTETPITESASTSSVTRITPSCAVIADPERPARFLSAQNRMFKHMGYDDVEQLEPAPGWEGPRATR